MQVNGTIFIGAGETVFDVSLYWAADGGQLGPDLVMATSK